MAVDPSLVCNLTTSWYYFTYTFSWSNDCEVAQLLSDIPFISIGILMFGLSTLFLVTRRISLSTLCILSSTLLAFVAAVLDLGQTLAYGIVLSMSSQPALRAREVLFALSTGFRFLFYWVYVAEPPRKLPSPPRRFQKFSLLTLECTNEHHSGSWVRWGVPGKMLGVSSLASIMVITALQIVWRVATQFHQYSNVYATDTVLELIVSFLLLLKLLSNTLTLNSPNSLPVHTFRECLAPISGLFVNIIIGVGNLLSFAFTESTVGRLLQALEIYIVVVFTVIFTFLRHCDYLLFFIASPRKKHRDVAFTLPEPIRGSTFRVTPPLIETPRISILLGTTPPNKQSSREVLRRSLNQISSWVSSRTSRTRLRFEDDEAKLWNAEKVKVDPPYTSDMDTELQASIVSLTQEPKEGTEYTHDGSTNHISTIPALGAQSVGALQGGQTSTTSGTNITQHTIALEAGTSYRAKHNGTPTPEASPADGNGSGQSSASALDSRISLDELLRQQSQLDQSIEALKSFSRKTSTNSSSFNCDLGLKGVELARSPSTGQRTISSDVSLSSFPIPPWLTTPVPSLPSSRTSPVGRFRGGKRVRLAAAQAVSAIPKTLVDIPISPHFDGIPSSPLGEGNETTYITAREYAHSDSGGTQLNVTSFIGGLATPDESLQGSQKAWQPTDEGARTNAPRTLPVPPRPEGLPACPAVVKRSPLAPSSLRSNLKTQLSQEAVDRAGKGFVRPRPLPLTIQSRRKQNADRLRVEVLADEVD